MSTLSKTIKERSSDGQEKEYGLEAICPYENSRPALVEGRDEMNLVELPLCGISDRYLDGRKTVVLADEIWDRQLGKKVPRELAVSGSDLYGLPTARDEDVLLACLQLSAQQEFRSREVRFTRYELLRLLRWPTESRYYDRLATSLRRWKGVSIFSNRAFYDHARKSWVNRDFGVFDNLYIYHREPDRANDGRCWFVWNEVLFTSFQAGYVKKLDWNLYCRLKSPIAKRLYRLLDKRFHFGDEVVLDLRQLAFAKVRLSASYHTGQIKRALLGGIRELEREWELQPLADAKRFVKRCDGGWDAVFRRKAAPRTKAAMKRIDATTDDLLGQVIRRGVGPATAAELVDKQSATTIRTMLALFDWYASRNQAKGPGFLVDSIRDPAKYRLPRDFSESRSSSRRPEHAIRARQSANASAAPSNKVGGDGSQASEFQAYWKTLGPDRRVEFESAAFSAASPMKQDGYRRHRAAGGAAWGEYREMILQDHYKKAILRRNDGQE